MKDLSPYNVDLNLYKQESYHRNLQLAPYYWIAILKSMPACTHTSDTDLNVAHYMEFHLKPKIIVIVMLPFTALRAPNCMFKVVSISPAFVKHVVLIDNILYVT